MSIRDRSILLAALATGLAFAGESSAIDFALRSAPHRTPNGGTRSNAAAAKRAKRRRRNIAKHPRGAA